MCIRDRCWVCLGSRDGEHIPGAIDHFADMIRELSAVGVTVNVKMFYGSSLATQLGSSEMSQYSQYARTGGTLTFYPFYRAWAHIQDFDTSRRPVLITVSSSLNKVQLAYRSSESEVTTLNPIHALRETLVNPDWGNACLLYTSPSPRD